MSSRIKTLRYNKSTYTNLKEKTIFDFCTDEQIINELVPVEKKRYLECIKETPLLNAHDLIEYAEITNNKELLKVVQEQYKSELQQENNE